MVFSFGRVSLVPRSVIECQLQSDSHTLWRWSIELCVIMLIVFTFSVLSPYLSCLRLPPSHPHRFVSLLISTGALLAIATLSLVSSTRLAYRILGPFRHS